MLIALVRCTEPRELNVVEMLDRHFAFTTADSWYSPPPDEEGFTEVTSDRFAPVAEELQKEAQAVLVDRPVKQITAQEAARLVGKPLPAGGVYVLLRGVVLFEGTGRFAMFVNESAVLVYHGCLGRGPAPMNRKALVAVLPSVPDTVYVVCSMAE